MPDEAHRDSSARSAAWLAGCVACFAASSAVPAPDTAAQFTARFERYGIGDGLSQSSVSAIAQDQRGFLWIGTREGLDRYDGYDFVTYRPSASNPNALSGGSVVAIASASNGDLWIGTTLGGLDRYDVENDLFEHYALPSPATSGAPGDVLAVLASRAGPVWIATARGLFVLDPSAPNPRLEAVLEQRMQALAEDGEGRILAASGDGRLLQLDPRPRAATAAVVAAWTLGTPARALAVAPNADVWIGLDSREFVRLTVAGRLERYFLDADLVPAGARIRALAFDRDGHLWIGGLGFGAARFDPVTGGTAISRHRPLDPFSLSSDDVVSLYIDASDRLWVGTLSGGLNRASLGPTVFMHYWHQPGRAGGLSHPAVTSFAADMQQTLWIGTDGGGVNRLDLQSGELQTMRADRDSGASIPGDRVWSLAYDEAATLWVGTWGQGLAYRRADSVGFTSVEVLPGRIVTALRADPQGLWVGTADAGLARLALDGSVLEVHQARPTDPQSLSADNVTAIHVDRAGRLWVGTWNAGLNRRDPGHSGFVRYRAAGETGPVLPHDSIRAIAEDEQGTLWFATGAGLARLVAGAQTFETFDRGAGLPDGTIYGVIPDTRGDLWLTSNRGIVRFSPPSGAVRIFGPDDGAQSYEFNGGASLRLADGRIAFGGINGFNLFDPADVTLAPAPSPVAITRISVLGRPLVPRQSDAESLLTVSPLVAERLELPHSANVLEISFVSPLPHDPDQQRFAYRLEGFDQDWREVASDQRTATYTNLSPGEYVFRVRSSNGDGLWSRVDRTLGLTVTPPWWTTPYAWAAYVAAALIAAFLIERRRTLVLRRRAQLLRDQVRRRTRELAAKTTIIEEQASRLREALATKERLFARVSHEFRTPLTLVLGPVEGLIEQEPEPTRKAALRLVQRNARRLLRLVDDLLGLAGLSQATPQEPVPLQLAPQLRAIVAAFESVAASKQLELVCPVLEDAWVDATEEAFERIVTNLLSNAVKYSSVPGRIELSLERDADRALLKVRDSGPGIAPEDAGRVFEPFYRADSREVGSGLGLALVRETVIALGGTVALENPDGGGALFVVDLPAIEPTPGSGRPARPDDARVREFDPAVTVDAESTGEYELPPAALSGGAAEKEKEDEDRASVLVIEDHADLRALIVGALSPESRCTTASTGASGLDMAFEQIPDLVVCDVMMPGMDGFEVTRRLKTEPATCHVPVVLLTALGDRSSRLLGLGERADDYIVKPFDPQELSLRVRNLIETRRIARRAFAREHVAGTSLDERASNATLGPRDRAFLERFDATVARHFDEVGCSIAALARDVAMSERQLQRKLRALLDTTPADYLREYRLQRAARWLLEGRAAGTVALDSGFATQSHFTECFKARFGVTPGDYAAKLRHTPSGRRSKR